MHMDELPTQRDFDPTGYDFDARFAWSHFGGMTLEEAFSRFIECPENYQEDFMFMGTAAFRFYFPVIDRFLRQTTHIPSADRGDRLSWILAQCLAHQFTEPDAILIRERRNEALDLCNFMIVNIDAFKDDWDPPSEILERWKSLRNQLKDLANQAMNPSRRSRP
jgi:hypothetical protein